MKEDKRRITYNINKEALDKFDRLTDERAINRSVLIEKLMLNWIKKCDDGTYVSLEEK